MFPEANEENHRLTKLPNRVVIDTNIILDASFNIQGISRRALELLDQMGYILILTGDIYYEARDVLHRKAAKLNLNFDPTRFLEKLLGERGFIEVDYNREIVVKEINKYDKHVARAALDNSAFVLTNDLSFYHECKIESIPVRFSWHVQNEHDWRNKNEYDPERIINIHPPAHNKGFIFTRVYTAWDSTFSNSKVFTVLEIENLGKLSYKAPDVGWTFKTATGIEVNIDHDFTNKDLITLMVNYDVNEKKVLELRSCHSTHPDQAQIKEMSGAKKIGKFTIGHDNNYTNHLNGYINYLVTGHKNIGKDSFKWYCQYKEALPNPWDKGMLEYYMQRSGIKETRNGTLYQYFQPNFFGQE